MWSPPPAAFFFNDTATTEIYTLSLHDALPISLRQRMLDRLVLADRPAEDDALPRIGDRKSTRLNSSHTVTSYAVFCLKKKTARSSELPENLNTIFFPSIPSVVTASSITAAAIS